MFNSFVFLLVPDLMTTRILIPPFWWFLSYVTAQYKITKNDCFNLYDK